MKFAFHKKNTKDLTVLRYGTVSLCNFLLTFLSINLAQQFRNRLSGDVASYLKGKEISHTPLRGYKSCHISRHLKMCNLLLWLNR